MPPAAYIILASSFCAALGLAALSAVLLGSGRAWGRAWLEYGHLGISIGLVAAVLSLLGSLLGNDFSLAYVAAHTERALPPLYRACALWAGQEGSLLLWAAAAALVCLVFQNSRAYTRLEDPGRLLFWLLHFLVMAFFLFLLVTGSNPFSRLMAVPSDGVGLNPLLRHPGMILHPPLLLLGYAGFSLPACLGAARGLLAGRNAAESWVRLVRPYMLAAWLLLTAGIILGAWWSYLELGWGGYWAWDPVENASLTPWLLTTAFLHTALLERKRKILHRANILLAGLTFTSTLAGAYLTRGGAADSLHSFGQSPVSRPLLLACLLSLVLAVAAALAARPPAAAGRGASEQFRPPLSSRYGLVLLGVWLLLALAAVITAATFSPAVSSLWSAAPSGFTPAFYNRVCLPLFTALTALIFTALLRGRGGAFPWKRAALHLLVIGLPLGAFTGFSRPLSSLAIIFSLGIAAQTCASLPGCRSAALGERSGGLRLAVKQLFAALIGIRPGAGFLHLGFALMVLAVAVSGPYKLETAAALAPGGQVKLGGYAFSLQSRGLSSAAPPGVETARLLVLDPDGEALGVLEPSRTRDAKTGLTHSEPAILSSAGRDIYAVCLGVSGNSALLALSIHPLVNWIWIGGFLTCLAAACRLAGLFFKRNEL